MKRKTVYLFILLTIINISLSSWVSLIETEVNDHSMGIEQTIDGNYIVFGKIYESMNEHPENVFFLMKVDIEGNMLWQEFLGGEFACNGGDIKVAPDGGFIIGASRTAYMYSHIYIAKTNPDGELEWENTFGQEGHSTGISVACTNDSGYIVTGYTSLDQRDRNFYTIKVDENGEEEWFNIYDTTTSDYGKSISTTNNGEFIICGEINGDIGLVKINSIGEEVWRNNYGGTDLDRGYDAVQTGDGGFIAIGKTHSFPTVPGLYDAYLVKTDSEGNEEWYRTYNGDEAAEGKNIFQTIEGGYIFAGNSGVYTSYIVKTDEDGFEEWETYYTYGDYPQPTIDMCEAVDEGYVICSSYYGNVLLIKLDNNGNVSIEENIIENNKKELYCFPNPFKYNTNISFSQNIEYICNEELIIYNIKGQKVKKFLNIKNKSSVIWNAKDDEGKDVSPGTYLFQLTTKNSNSEVKKMILLK
ncbi:MAG TPA: T9SS type A sorting domain-containing protein [Candidatus Cloacimonetes bacterium]|nr:T9SS type A sorting domain-containing protein [Candidatus Cloacimonadota bacterium]